MKLEFKYTNNLINYLLNIEKYKTALEYLYLPTRTKQKLMYDVNLKKHISIFKFDFTFLIINIP